jgi:hypothetical protein
MYDQLRPGHGASCPCGQPYQSGTCCYTIETIYILETVLCLSAASRPWSILPWWSITPIRYLLQYHRDKRYSRLPWWSTILIRYLLLYGTIETIDILETVLCITDVSRPWSILPWWSTILTAHPFNHPIMRRGPRRSALD